MTFLWVKTYSTPPTYFQRGPDPQPPYLCLRFGVLSWANYNFKPSVAAKALIGGHCLLGADQTSDIRHWAVLNKLILNLDKTKEIVFRRPRVQHFHLPPRVEDIEQLYLVSFLGVIFFQSILKLTPMSSTSLSSALSDYTY